MIKVKDWWKDPRLDDEGTYDYLVEELPKDHCNWSMQRYTSKCDSCGKERHLLFRATHYFYCWDGWDSDTYTECWRCMVKNKILSIKNKIKKRIKAFKTAWELYNISRKCQWNWKKCYDMALKFER